MRKLITATLSAAVFTVVATYSGIAQQNQMSFFVTSVGSGNGRQPRRAGGSRQALPDARGRCRRRQPDLARLSERRGGGRAAGGQRRRIASARDPGST